MPVLVADRRHGGRAQHVYVLPSDAVLTIEKGHLRSRAWRTAASASRSTSSSSLAEDQSEDAVGIVLSGGGSDGTLGIKAIKEHGGLTLAQGQRRHRAGHSEHARERHRDRAGRPGPAGRGDGRRSSSAIVRSFDAADGQTPAEDAEQS